MVEPVTGGTPYAIGTLDGGRLHVRTIRYGKLSASHERRKGERLYRVMLTLAELPSRPIGVTNGAVYG